MAYYGGGVIPGNLDYETFVGLWLNRHRAIAPQAAAVAMGISKVFSSRPTSPNSISLDDESI